MALHLIITVRRRGGNGEEGTVGDEGRGGAGRRRAREQGLLLSTYSCHLLS